MKRWLDKEVIEEIPSVNSWYQMLFSFVNPGAAFATATCGGYIIITTGLLIAAATGELSGRKTVIPYKFL